MFKKKFNLYYEIFISILAIISVTITLFDLVGRIAVDRYLLTIDIGILLIFAIDYFYQIRNYNL